MVSKWRLIVMAPEAMKRAVRGGVNSIEHGTYMDDEVICADEATWYLVCAYHHRRKIRC